MLTGCGIEVCGMTELKLSAIPDSRSVKITVELPDAVNRDLVAYGELLGHVSGQIVADPAS